MCQPRLSVKPCFVTLYRAVRPSSRADTYLYVLHLNVGHKCNPSCQPLLNARMSYMKSIPCPVRVALALLYSNTLATGDTTPATIETRATGVDEAWTFHTNVPGRQGQRSGS